MAQVVYRARPRRPRRGLDPEGQQQGGRLDWDRVKSHLIRLEEGPREMSLDQIRARVPDV